MTRARERRSITGFLDRLIAAPLQWVTGPPVEDTASPARVDHFEVDDALGELASWTGLGAKRRRAPR